MQERCRDLLIIGAGIGGLALALAAGKRGLRTVVWERAAELREIGAGLLLTSNAVWVLQQLGLLDEACRRGHVVQRWEILDRRGKVLQTFASKSDDVGSISIARSAFQQLLLAALPSGAVTLDHEVTSILVDETNGCATARTEGQSMEADLIVGADGARSIVRRMCFDPRPTRPFGYVGWRSFHVS